MLFTIENEKKMLEKIFTYPNYSPESTIIRDVVKKQYIAYRSQVKGQILLSTNPIYMVESFYKGVERRYIISGFIRESAEGIVCNVTGSNADYVIEGCAMIMGPKSMKISKETLQYNSKLCSVYEITDKYEVWNYFYTNFMRIYMEELSLLHKEHKKLSEISSKITIHRRREKKDIK